MLKRNEILVCLLVWLPTLFTAEIAFGSDTPYTCGHDFNNDGDFAQQGEMAGCIQADAGGPFCPLAPVDCVLVQKDATCPSGTTLNTGTHRCEANPTCSSGTYDPNSKTCILVTPATCPDGSTLNGEVDKCQASPTCSDGDYDPKQDMCIEISDRTCPSGTVLNTASNKCEAEPVCVKGIYNQAYNACVFTGTGDAQCPSGSSLNTATDRCEAPPECSTGTYDATSNMCINSVTTTNATCPQGTVNNLTRDVCEGNGTCIAGTSYDSSSKLCTAAPGCQAGAGKYDTSLNMCYTSGSADLLTTVGFLFSSLGPFSCEANTNRTGGVDTCTPQVKYDETVDRIDGILAQLGIGATCPAQTSLDQTTLLCAQHPLCADGSTLDLGRNICTATPSCDQGIFDLATHKCMIVYNDTFVPVCPAGTTILEASSDKCISSAQCVAGTTLNSSTNKCETTIGCPSGVYDTVKNYCVLNSAVTCPASSTFNPVSQKCEASFTCPVPSTYDPVNKNCSYGSGPISVDCPGSGSYNSVYNLCQVIIWVWESCPSPYTFWFWDGQYGVACQTSPTCPAGYTRSGSKCYPKPAVAVTCPAGTTFNTTNALCDAAPSCPLGAIYDSSKQSCSTIVNPICIVGTTMNTSTDRCESPVTCLNGFLFNPATHRCEADPACPTGSHYDGSQDKCIQNNGYIDATCPKDTTLNPSTDWCEGAPQCSTGAVYNQTTKQCEATPYCPPNGTLKYTTFDWDIYYAPGYKYAYCDIPASTSDAICVSGTTLDTDTDKCISTVQCPSGSFFNPATQWCEAAPFCPSNSYYYPSLGVCVTTVNTQPSCPAGMTFTGVADLCIQPPGCLGGTYDPVNDICNINSITSPVCPSGTTASASAGKCIGSLQCPNGGVYDATINQCVRKTYPNCISNLTLNKTSDLCETMPTCPPNTGAYDSISNQCMLSTAPVCPLTFSFDTIVDKCTTIPTCSIGNFDPATNLCQNTGGSPTAAVCPAGTSLDIHLDKCAADPVCSVGGYNPYLDKCSAPATCLSGIYNKTTDLCDVSPGVNAPPVCPSGMVLDTLSDVCVISPICPSGTSLSPASDKCVSDPGCSSGVYDPSIDMCVPFLKTCPLNTPTTTYACPMVGGVQKCSADVCVDANGIPVDPPATNNLTNDGTVDTHGQCLGQIRIFNGTSARCLLVGARTMYADCCHAPIPEDVYNQTHVYDTFTDPLRIFSSDQEQMLFDYFKIFDGGCNQSEVLLNIAIKEKRTHFIGQYCVAKILAWCIQRGQMHCIFNSVLARIIHEQGRPQLTRFGPDGGWGTVDQPNCEGFTIGEFQMLDFSRIDLSEFINYIADRVRTTLSNAVADRASTFYDQTLSNFTSGATTTN